MARPKIGDVVEIRTAKGLAYAQYTHQKEKWGALLRVLPGFHERRPSSWEGVVNQAETFVIFFPLGAAVARRMVQIVAHVEVPASAQSFPLFRAAGGVDRQGRVLDWWLWDGDRSWKIGKLGDEQRRLPIRVVCNDTALVERIESGWTPATDGRSQG